VATTFKYSYATEILPLYGYVKEGIFFQKIELPFEQSVVGCPFCMSEMLVSYHNTTQHCNPEELKLYMN
jgi:hypothetical protein